VTAVRIERCAAVHDATGELAGMIAVNDALGFGLCPPAFHTVELAVPGALA